MKNILFLITVISLIGCKKISLEKNIVSKRIDFILHLKKQVGDNSWKEFGKKINEGPLFYYQKDTTYLFFIDKVVKENLLITNHQKEYYKLKKRYDATPFHMETQIEFEGDSKNPILLNHPIEFCSSPEETQKFIPSVTSTEIWATMVIHEMFHHFQFNNSSFKNYMKSITTLGFDNRNLKKLLDSDKTFKRDIIIENDLLLKVLVTKNKDSINSFLHLFLKKRIERRYKYNKVHPNFTKVEDAFEKMEGSARYIEYQSMVIMRKLATTNSYAIKDDTLFNNYTDFKKFDISNKDFKYLQTVSYDYYYTLGFNLLRVLDKLNINHQKMLFTIPEKSLTSFISESQQNNKNYFK